MLILRVLYLFASFPESCSLMCIFILLKLRNSHLKLFPRKTFPQERPESRVHESPGIRVNGPRTDV